MWLYNCRRRPFFSEVLGRNIDEFILTLEAKRALRSALWEALARLK
jgi:hypothetical protein